MTRNPTDTDITLGRGGGEGRKMVDLDSVAQRKELNLLRERGKH
jgi:hypothetical protein